MAPDPSDAKTPLECCLKEGLSALAGAVREVGADCVSVIVAEPRETIRLVYHWPDSGRGPLEFSGAPAVETSRGLVAAESTLGRFLKQAAPAAASFLLVPWPEQPWRVAIAFGFSSRQPPPLDVSQETASTLHLASLATWIAWEIRRLRRELHVVSDRLGRRKLVERAKGMLQARHGWSEQHAYEHIRRLSRQRRKSMADTAQEILRSPALFQRRQFAETDPPLPGAL